MTSPAIGPATAAADCPCPSRRSVLRSAAALGGSAAAVGLLAGCGSGGSGAPAAAGTTLGAASDVPVGGGAIFPDAQVVVTQPTEGEFRAFSSLCTHQGCQVSEVTDAEIVCTCHGSRFSIEDGSPVSGPATEPLGEEEVSVEGSQLVLS